MIATSEHATSSPRRPMPPATSQAAVATAMAAASRGGSGAPVGGAVQMVRLKAGMRILKHFPNQSESDYYDYYEGVLLWFDPTVGTAEGGCWHVHYGDGDAEDISEADLPPLLRRWIEHDRNADPTGSNLRIFTYASFEGIAPKRPQHAELWGRQPICLSEATETRIPRGTSPSLLSPSLSTPPLGPLPSPSTGSSSSMPSRPSLQSPSSTPPLPPMNASGLTVDHTRPPSSGRQGPRSSFGSKTAIGGGVGRWLR